MDPALTVFLICMLPSPCDGIYILGLPGRNVNQSHVTIFLTSAVTNYQTSGVLKWNGLPLSSSGNQSRKSGWGRVVSFPEALNLLGGGVSLLAFGGCWQFWPFLVSRCRTPSSVSVFTWPSFQCLSVFISASCQNTLIGFGATPP